VFESYGREQAPATAITAGPGVPSSSKPARATVEATARTLEWAPIAATIGFVGAIAGIGVLAAGLLRLFWIAARAKPITAGPWPEIALDLSRSLGLRRRVALFQGTHPSMLITWGVISPKVIVPPAALAWSNERIRVVLAHELAHVRRGDWVLQVGASLLRAFYWFNPLVWVLCRRLRLESEMACDDEVMNDGVRGFEYAHHLVSVARELNQRRQLWLLAPAMAQPSSLERRVNAMLNDHANRRSLPRASRAAILVVLLLGVAAIAAAQGQFVALRGTVADESGRGVPNVVLTLVDESRRAKYEIRSGDGGQFEFVGLRSGQYLFTIAGPGFRPSSEPLVVGTRDIQRTVTLKIGSLQETLFVSIDASVEEQRPRIRDVGMPAPRECAVVDTGGRIVPPLKVRDVRPEYPASLRGTGTAGVVVLNTTIGADGYVSDIDIDGEAHPELAAAAIAAVRDWRFTQTLLNCAPVPVSMTVTVTFGRK
jgi:TonB family protein